MIIYRVKVPNNDRFTSAHLAYLRTSHSGIIGTPGIPDPASSPDGREVIAITANVHLLSQPVAGSVLRARMPGSPRPLRDGHLHLSVMDSAPYWARQYTRLFLAHCRDITEDTAETAQLLVSELVTNATRASACHFPGREPSYSEHEGFGVIGLSLRHFPDGLLIEVSDSSPEPPILIHAGRDAETGRGLLLVDALSREWGYFPAPDGGKVVYCLVSLP